MIEPQSESSIPPPLKARGARGVMKLDQEFAEGKRNGAWPGQRCLTIFPRPRRERIKVRVKGAAC